MFDGIYLTTIKQIYQPYVVCAHVNLEGTVHPPPPPTQLLKSVHRGGTYPGEAQWLDFTQMSPCKGSKFLLVFVILWMD